MILIKNYLYTDMKLRDINEKTPLQKPFILINTGKVLYNDIVTGVRDSDISL